MLKDITKFCKFTNKGITVYFPEYFIGKKLDSLSIDSEKMVFGFISRNAYVGLTNNISDLIAINDDDCITFLHKLRKTVSGTDRISIFKNCIRFYDADFFLIRKIEF